MSIYVTSKSNLGKYLKLQNTEDNILINGNKSLGKSRDKINLEITTRIVLGF